MIHRLGQKAEMSVRINHPFFTSVRFVLVMTLLGTVLMGASRGCVGSDSEKTMNTLPTSFAIYTLSRGKGVPDSARQALVQSRALLLKAQSRGEVLRLMEHRIGLEGETRVCVEFDSAEAAQKMMNQVQELTQGMDLIQTKVERCPSSSE